MRTVLVLMFMLLYSLSPAQDGAIVAYNNPMSNREGQFFITWGYNRAYYNKSTIHFQGEHYDFTLHNARAEDIPESWDPGVYLNPLQFTVPQFNFRVGYYFNENTAISGGWDHMKYHLVPHQLVSISGDIDDEYYFNPEYTGHFDHENIWYTPQFMDYHHSDGFNFIRIALERRVALWSSHNQKFMLSYNGTVSAGVMMPWTDFTFFGVNHRNKPHVAGYGFSGCSAVRFEFLEYLFLQLNMQLGWCDLRDIMLEDHLSSRAQQKITFFERDFSIGGYIPIFTKRK